MDKLTVDDCGKYPIGSTVWFLTFECADRVTLGDDYDVYSNEHPIFLFSKTPIKCLWQTTKSLPKLEATTFDAVLSMMTSKLVARSMVVDTITISENTGEFIYGTDHDDVILPEIIIFKDRNGAMRERTRILKIIRNWIDKQLGEEHDMFSMQRHHKKQSSRRTNCRTKPDDNQTTTKD